MFGQTVPSTNSQLQCSLRTAGSRLCLWRHEHDTESCLDSPPLSPISASDSISTASDTLDDMPPPTPFEEFPFSEITEVALPASLDPESWAARWAANDDDSLLSLVDQWVTIQRDISPGPEVDPASSEFESEFEPSSSPPPTDTKPNPLDSVAYLWDTDATTSPPAPGHSIWSYPPPALNTTPVKPTTITTTIQSPVWGTPLLVEIPTECACHVCSWTAFFYGEPRECYVCSGDADERNRHKYHASTLESHIPDFLCDYYETFACPSEDTDDYKAFLRAYEAFLRSEDTYDYETVLRPSWNTCDFDTEPFFQPTPNAYHFNFSDLPQIARIEEVEEDTILTGAGGVFPTNAWSSIRDDDDPVVAFTNNYESIRDDNDMVVPYADRCACTTTTGFSRVIERPRRCVV